VCSGSDPQPQHSSIWHIAWWFEQAVILREFRRKWPIMFEGRGRVLWKSSAAGILKAP